MIHVAVLKPEYLDAILDGTKTVESRLSRVRCDPFSSIHVGERIYFKATGGEVLATALAAQVDFFPHLTPAKIASVRRAFAASVGAPDEYWRAKREARFATFITLAEVEPVRFGPRFPAFYGRAWQRLPDSADVYPRCLSPRRAASA